uniref:Uncharacterized protein n=1 Tax=Vitis vinifera TaxID=29760 RepID=F6I716_VITVI
MNSVRFCHRCRGLLVVNAISLDFSYLPDVRIPGERAPLVSTKWFFIIADFCWSSLYYSLLQVDFIVVIIFFFFSAVFTITPYFIVHYVRNLRKFYLKHCILKPITCSLHLDFYG